jgi:hypothetical protein
MNKDWNSSTSDYGRNPMDVKRSNEIDGRVRRAHALLSDEERKAFLRSI